MPEFKCDETCKAIVNELKKNWGDNAETYWNDNNFVVIAKDGYVSEFRRDGTMIHSGIIR